MKHLVDRILSGKGSAIESFYHQYSPGILRFLISKLPRTEDAQDILNDVFLDAIEALPTLRDKAQLQAWLFKIAHNKIANFYRKKKIKSLLFSQFPYLKIIASEIEQPEFQLEKRELALRLHITLKKLSRKYQQILQMHYLEGMPVKLISLQLNLSFKATESRLYRARQQFMRQYQLTL